MHERIGFVLLSLIAISMSLDQDITKGPPSYDKPWVPGWGFNSSDPTQWQKLHLDLVKQTEQNLANKVKVRVVFFGDSKTYFWKTEGKQPWQQYYNRRGAFNYGIRGDSTRQILWRIEHNELEGLSPDLLVFMIGGNNFKNNYNRGTDEEIVKAMLIIIDKFRQVLPKTKIIFVGQLPRESSTITRAKEVNKLLDEHYSKSSDQMVTFVNFYNHYLNLNGTQNTDLYVADKIHLNRPGYELLAQLLEPSIKKDLNEQ